MMDIHKPKPWHGLREFLKEILVIVCGVLIAIALEQTVEALHHRSQAREMAEKLKSESEENVGVIALDVASGRALEAAAGDQIRLLSASDHPDAEKIGLPPRPSTLRPSDAAWVSIRDGALMPIMPPLLIQNYWKVDAMDEAVQRRIDELGRAYLAAQSSLDVLKLAPNDPDLKREALLRLSDMRSEALALAGSTEFFGRLNERALQGKAIDLDLATRAGAR